MLNQNFYREVMFWQLKALNGPLNHSKTYCIAQNIDLEHQIIVLSVKK